MIKYFSFDVADLGPLAAIIPAREPEVRLALNRLPVVQGRDASGAASFARTVVPITRA